MSNETPSLDNMSTMVNLFKSLDKIPDDSIIEIMIGDIKYTLDKSEFKDVMSYYIETINMRKRILANNLL